MTPVNYEIYQPWIRTFEIISNVLTILTLFASIIAAKIILTKTSNILKMYRLLLIALIVAQQINSTVFLFFKTIYLIPTDAFIVKATFFVSGSFFTTFSPVMELMMILIIADILLCMFIERYYAMTSSGITTVKIPSKLLYFGIGFTNFLLFLSYMIALLVGKHHFNAEESQKYIKENFQNFNSTNQLFGVNTVFSSLSWYTAIFLFFVAIFMSTRIFGYLFYSHKIMAYLKMLKSQNNLFSQKSATINAIKTLLIQLFTLIVFGCIPLTIIVAFFIFKPEAFQLELCLQLLYHFYFLVDMVSIVLLIRPYRRALLQFICKNAKVAENHIRSSVAIISVA